MTNPAVVNRWTSSTTPTAVALRSTTSTPSTPSPVIPSFSQSFRPTRTWPSGRSSGQVVRAAAVGLHSVVPGTSRPMSIASSIPESNSKPRTSTVSFPPVEGTRQGAKPQTSRATRSTSGCSFIR